MGAACVLTPGPDRRIGSMRPASFARGAAGLGNDPASRVPRQARAIEAGHLESSSAACSWRCDSSATRTRRARRRAWSIPRCSPRRRGPLRGPD